MTIYIVTKNMYIINKLQILHLENLYMCCARLYFNNHLNKAQWGWITLRFKFKIAESAEVSQNWMF